MSSRHVPAAVALVAAIPVAVWWAVGDLSERGVDHLDYMVRPIELPTAVENLAGVLAMAVAVIAATVLAVAVHRNAVSQQWSATVVPLCVAGAIVGAGWRVVTAGGIGADIGGAFVVMFGLPLVLALVIAAAANGWAARRHLA